MNSPKNSLAQAGSDASDLLRHEESAKATLRMAALLALLFALLYGAVPMASAQTETVLYTFCSLPYCEDGTTPAAGLTLDSYGNLYGAAQGGDSDFYGGVVFQLSTKNKETEIFNFSAVQEGVAPNGALIRDSSGNIYGTTAGGGYDQGPCKGYFGCGLVYKLSNGDETVLYTFLGKSDGLEPNGGLVLDGKGNLYGTTYKGGGGGTVFKVSPEGTETVLHRFAGGSKDGRYPSAGLVMDGDGNLYGTTSEGGGVNGDYLQGLACQGDCGAVFELTAAGDEKILYAFKGWTKEDGAGPFASLILDSQGELYGTTYAGGTYGYGTVFKLTSAGEESVLYSFLGSPDGQFPASRLLMDSHGNLYGTTVFGGVYGYGTVFEISASGKETVLYNFTGGADGAFPKDGLVMDGHGNLYGTTPMGGNFNESSCPYGCGVAFKVSP